MSPAPGASLLMLFRVQCPGSFFPPLEGFLSLKWNEPLALCSIFEACALRMTPCPKWR